MVAHVGCHRNVSLIGTRPQSGESKTAVSMVLSAWAWEPRVGHGAEVSHGEEGILILFISVISLFAFHISCKLF